MSFHRTLEMSISRDDFVRLMASVVDSFDMDGDVVRWLDAGRAWTVRLVALPERRVGSVAVPGHRVEIDLESCSDTEGEDFLRRFRRTFMRGGG